MSKNAMRIVAAVVGTASGVALLIIDWRIGIAVYIAIWMNNLARDNQ